MSTEKGDLIGITRKELEAVAKAAIHSEPRGDALVAVALAAQKALLEELIQRSNEWDIDQPISSMMIPVVIWDEVCAKLEMK